LDTEVIILAAGFSSRAGVFKMNLLFDKITLIEKSVLSFYDICSTIIVVGGYKIEEIVRTLEKYKKVKIVFNANYEKGMFSSVKEGIKYISTERFFLTPGDYPLINSKLCTLMLDVEGEIIIPICNNKKGHPILLKKHLINKILNEPESSNLRDFIRKEKYVTYETKDHGILIDIDTLKDYENAKKS